MFLYFLFFFMIFFIILSFFLIKHHSMNNIFSSFNIFIANLGGLLEDIPVWLFIIVLPISSFKYGFSSVWMLLGLVLGVFFSRILISERLIAMLKVLFKKEKFGYCYDIKNLYSFFEKRYYDNSSTLVFVSSFFLVIFSFGIISAGIVALIHIINLVEKFSSVSYVFSTIESFILFIVFLTLVCVFYNCLELLIFNKSKYSSSFKYFITVLNGFSSLLIPIFMIFFILYAIITFKNVNILSDLISEIPTLISSDPNIFGVIEFSNTNVSKVTLVLSGLGWSLGLFGVPTFFLRVVSTYLGNDENINENNISHSNIKSQIRKNTIISTTWAFLIGFVTILAGLIFRIILLESNISISSELDIFKFLGSVHNIFSILIFSIYSLTFISIICFVIRYMTFIRDSFVDIILPSFGKTYSDNKTILLKILTSVVLIPGCFILVFSPTYSLVELTAYPWTGFGASFGSALLFSLYYRKTTKNSILTGVVAGGIFGAVWRQLSVSGNIIFSFNEIIPAFIFASLIILLLSNYESKKRFNPKTEKDFSEMEKNIR